MVDRLAAAVERVGVALGLGQGQSEVLEAGAADARGAVGHRVAGHRGQRPVEVEIVEVAARDDAGVGRRSVWIRFSIE